MICTRSIHILFASGGKKRCPPLYMFIH
jgi:hypothetical protein